MSIIILVLLVLAVVTFIYGSIVAPSLRASLRYTLFNLRDEVRLLMHERPAGVTDDALTMLHSGINNAITIIRTIDGAMLSEIDQLMKTDESLRKRVERRIRTMNQCSNADFKRIHASVSSSVQNAFLINSGSWFIYIVPIAFVASLLRRCAGVCAGVAAIPEHEFSKVSPPLAHA